MRRKSKLIARHFAMRKCTKNVVFKPAISSRGGLAVRLEHAVVIIPNIDAVNNEVELNFPNKNRVKWACAHLQANVYSAAFLHNIQSLKNITVIEAMNVFLISLMKKAIGSFYITNRLPHIPLDLSVGVERLRRDICWPQASVCA
jgi:hypothetical protein